MNATEALVEVPLAGAEVIVVSGATVSGIPAVAPYSKAPASAAAPTGREPLL